VLGVNRFKSFLDKLFVLYHASPKNSRELQLCAKLSEVQLLKIGRILRSGFSTANQTPISLIADQNWKMIADQVRVVFPSPINA